MPSLTLKRDAFSTWMLASVTIDIDSQTSVKLKYGEEKTISLAAGTYSLLAKMRWVKSVPLSVTLKENDHKRIFIGCLPHMEACIMTFIPPFVAFTLKEESTAPNH